MRTFPTAASRASWRLALFLLACGPRPAATTTPPVLPGEPPAPGQAALPAAPPEPDPWAGRTDLVKPPPPQPAAPVALAPITRFTLPNGLQVLLVEDHALPVVSLDLAVKVGTLDEPREKRSLGAFAAAMLTRGTTRRTADQLAAAIDQVGGRLDAGVALASTHLTCQTLAKDLRTCLTLLPEVVINPRFPEAQLAEVRSQLEASLRQRRDDPAALGAEHFENALWGDDHVRGWPITAQTIAAVRPRDLVEWHRTWFRPGNAILVVSGDLDGRTARSQVTGAFGRWPRGAGEPPAHKSYKEPKPAGVRVRLVDKPDLAQSHLLLGHLGHSVSDPDWLADEVNSYILGEGASARLVQVARAGVGKTDAAESRFEAERTRGEFRAQTFTRTAETVPTLRWVLAELAKMRQAGPTADEVAAAQANLAGTHSAELQSAPAIGRAILQAELLGLGDAFVRDFPLKVSRVTVEEARAAARQRLDPDDVVVVIVGRASEVGPQLRKAGYQVEAFGWLDPPSRRERDAATQKNAPASPIRPARAAEAKRLLDAALQAKGGEDRLRAVKDVVTTGTVKVVDRGQTLEGPFTRWLVPGEALRLDIKTGMGALTVAVTAAGAWVRLGTTVQHQPQELAAQYLASLWRDRDFVLLRHLDPGTVAEATGRERVDGRDYDVVVLKKADGSLPTRILLDPRSRMIFRLEYEERGAPQREEYRDYKLVQGIPFAMKQHAEGQGQTIDAITSDVKLNGGVPAGTFDKPQK